MSITACYAIHQKIQIFKCRRDYQSPKTVLVVIQAFVALIPDKADLSTTNTKQCGYLPTTYYIEKFYYPKLVLILAFGVPELNHSVCFVLCTQSSQHSAAVPGVSQLQSEPCGYDVPVQQPPQ